MANTNNTELAKKALMEGLNGALDTLFAFEGSFAFLTRMSEAANPCLDIGGIGLIGLPLSGDSNLIIKSSVETKTLSNKEAHTWKIEPQKVSFQNKEWETFIHSTAINVVCPGLGIQADKTRFECRLHKLLLYGPGSRPLHQENQRADGVFATMMVVLPSTNTGGQIRLSHGKQSTTLDLSQDSIASTFILAWYTDVRQKARPIASGYRLVLVYNLVHESNPVDIPSVSHLDHSAQHLCKILRTWKKGVYETLPQGFFVAYLLKRLHSEHELDTMSLNGVDAHKISLLRDIAKELGYTICLGNLTVEITGDASYSGIGISRLHKKGCCSGPGGVCTYGGCASNVFIKGTYDTQMSISNVVDLNGVRVLNNDLVIDNKESLIPATFLNDLEPDRKEHSGYTDSSAGTLRCWFCRTVIILIQEQDSLDVYCSKHADGFDYGSNRLEKCNNTLAYTMIRNLRSLPKENDSGDAGREHRIADNVKFMVDYALRWEDSEIWSATMQHAGGLYLKTFGTDTYFEGWDKLVLSKIDQGLECTISKTSQLSERLDFIYAIHAHATYADNLVSEDYYRKKVITALSGYELGSHPDDVDALLHLCQKRGFGFVLKSTNSNNKKWVSFDFWLSLVRCIVEKKGTLRGSRTDDDTAREATQPQHDLSSKLRSGSGESEFGLVVKHCLDIVSFRWNVLKNEEVEAGKFKRLVQILDVCCLAGYLEPCHRLLDSVRRIDSLARTDLLPARYESLYMPLVLELTGILRKYNIAFTSPPFDAFLKWIVVSYCQYILGTSRSLTEEVAKQQKIGCGNVECSNGCPELNCFMVDIDLQEKEFSVEKSKRKHMVVSLNSFLVTRTKRCTWKTLRNGRTHVLKVTKSADYFAKMSWEGRKAAASSFLKSFGDDRFLEELQETLPTDVSAALKDVIAYQPPQQHTQLPHTTTPLTSSIQNSIDKTSHQAAGESNRDKKRKRPYKNRSNKIAESTKENR